jgi:hypothetical protein
MNLISLKKNEIDFDFQNFLFTGTLLDRRDTIPLPPCITGITVVFPLTGVHFILLEVTQNCSLS